MTCISMSAGPMPLEHTGYNERSGALSGVVQNIARSGTPAARKSGCLVSPFMVRSTSYFSNAMPTSTQDICHEK